MKILTALVTPFTAGELCNQINYEVLDQLVLHQITHGADGIILGGTTGEICSLSEEEVISLYTYVTSRYSDKIKIYLNVGLNDTAKTIKLVKKVEHLNHYGYLMVVPYYNLPNDEGIYRHFELINEVVDRDIILYNVPKRTGIDLPINLIERLSQLSHVKGLKEASKAIGKVLYLQKSKMIDVYLGNDELFLYGLALEIEGIISVASNLYIEQMKQGFKEYSFIKRTLNQLKKEINPIGIKKLLNEHGFNVGNTRLPLKMK